MTENTDPRCIYCRGDRPSHSYRAANADHRYAPTFEVGDGATTQIGSDAQPWTVIAVSTSGKTIIIQADNYELDKDWKPQTIPGGFVGHTVNNQDQRDHYVYSANENSPVRRARLTKRGWESNGTPVSHGRHAFYDYNF